VARYAGPISERELQKLTAAEIQAMYSKMLAQGLSGTTVLQWHRILHKALSVAEGQGKIPFNPSAKGKVLPPPKADCEMTVWDEDTLYRFFEFAKDTYFRDIYHLAVLTGMRRSELCTVKWTNVDFNNRTISVTSSLHRLKGREIKIQPPKDEAIKAAD
jgi:integrase